MPKRKNDSAVLFELPQLTFDLTEGRPRIVTTSTGHYRMQEGVFLRYMGRSRWHPDVSAPTQAEMRVRDALFSHPTLHQGEACCLLSA
jgi:hypothetical protein